MVDFQYLKKSSHLQEKYQLQPNIDEPPTIRPVEAAVAEQGAQQRLVGRQPLFPPRGAQLPRLKILILAENDLVQGGNILREQLAAVRFIAAGGGAAAAGSPSS